MVRFPSGTKDLSLPHSVQTGYISAPPAYYSIDNAATFFGGQAAGTWSWPFIPHLVRRLRMNRTTPTLPHNFMAFRGTTLPFTSLNLTTIIFCYGRSQWLRILSVGLWPPTCWDIGFESRRGNESVFCERCVTTCLCVRLISSTWVLPRVVCLSVISKSQRRGGRDPLVAATPWENICILLWVQIIKLLDNRTTQANR
jgi:hypothetical protein